MRAIAYACAVLPRWCPPGTSVLTGIEEPQDAADMLLDRALGVEDPAAMPALDAPSAITESISRSRGDLPGGPGADSYREHGQKRLRHPSRRRRP